MDKCSSGGGKSSLYAELHCHSAFSLLDGASNPEELVGRAVELGLSALALTDHDDLGGSVRFAHAAREAGLEGIIGAEITLQDGSHMVLLAMDEEGYKNICRLITLSRFGRERGEPRISLAELFERNGGLIALSGCPRGLIPSLLSRKDRDGAAAAAMRMQEVFGDRFYLEVWNHHILQEQVIAREIVELAAARAIPWVVSNNVHYAVPEKRIVHDVLTCLRHQTTLAGAGRRLRPNGSWYLKSPAEMARLWRHDLAGIRRTIEVAERCRFRLGSLKTPLPVFQPAPEIASICGIDRDLDLDHNALLRKLVWEGAGLRYPVLTPAHVRQIEHELAMIIGLDLAPYFLIMWDIVRFARSRGIAVQGRGSAANSAVCYCLMITAVDPVGMELLFERFLSEGRHEPPDIDLDIAHQERETVLQYVYEKYGREHAAMVCEIITYRGRSAVRDAARVLGFSQETADRLAAEAEHSEARGAVLKLLDGGLENAGLDSRDRRVQLLLNVVSGLHQLPRHRSIHVGGFVLSGRPLGELVPIEPAAMDGRTVIQWDKDDIDLVGMIKIDLLGLGMLTMIQEGLKLVSRFRGVDIDIGQLDMHDPSIYKMLCDADTIGVFQVESRAQMNILPRLKPSCFYDIIVSIAIVRPGPIQGNIIHPYLRRRRKEEEVVYLHPSLEPILQRTLGVPLFQEQGMKLAVVAAGFTPSQADQLRRVMSHKRSQEKMDRLCEELAAGMRKNDFSEDAIATITHQLRAFANYGFPESHAASFSLLVYASAYLKRYYRPEFYCAILNAQPMGFYSPATLVRDALRHGVRVCPVDLGRSAWDCTLEPDDRDGEPALRIGLRYVDGLGRKARDSLLLSWRNGGVFQSIDDVVARSGLSAADLKVLARAGAFESFCPGRRQALWQVLGKLKAKRPTPLLDSLHEMAGLSEQETPPPVLAELSELETVVTDFRMMGLSTSEHPMRFYRSWAEERGIFTCTGLAEDGEDGTSLSVAGAVICRQRPGTAKGFVFLTLEDETGLANVIIRPPIFEKYRRVILSNSFLRVDGRLQLEFGVANVIAMHFEPLPTIAGDPLVRSRNFH
ncbi:MAG: error-prone DNA polymerase [Candidatus Melainabacteria bacterium]|nr:error-prone DNA polymerase [Candidatus Melainabacteria bacterium]